MRYCHCGVQKQLSKPESHAFEQRDMIIISLIIGSLPHRVSVMISFVYLTSVCFSFHSYCSDLPLPRLVVLEVKRESAEMLTSNAEQLSLTTRSYHFHLWTEDDCWAGSAGPHSTSCSGVCLYSCRTGQTGGEMCILCSTRFAS